MCGVYGFIGKPTKETPRIIKHLGLLNESRGGDSTGLAVITRKNIVIDKKAINATAYFKGLNKHKVVAQYRNASFLTVLGHTRLATTGMVNDKNAHPFMQDNIIFTHNGIISNFYELETEHKTDFNVDSEIIGHLLANIDYKEAFKNLAGFFTVPYVDILQPDLLHVAVHNQVFSYAFKGDQVYYSSDIKHLKYALMGLGFQICQGGDDVLYRFYMVNNKMTVSKEKITAKPYVYAGYSTSGYSYYQNDTTWKTIAPGHQVYTPQTEQKALPEPKNTLTHSERALSKRERKRLKRLEKMVNDKNMWKYSGSWDTPYAD